MGGWTPGYNPFYKPAPEPKRPPVAPDDEPGTTDQMARSYANLRFECADLEAIIADAKGLTEKDLKRLDKAVTVMKVAFKIVAKVLRQYGHETGRKRLTPVMEPGARDRLQALTGRIKS